MRTILQNKMTFFACALACLGAAFTAGPARADDKIRRPGDHPRGLEIEPHTVLGWDGIYMDTGYGAGARLSIPVVDNGFVPKINNSVAVSFGLDLLRYDGCWYSWGNCSATFVESPVAMQWNFYVSDKWSVFGEPGLVFYHGFLSDCPAGSWCGAVPQAWGAVPAFNAGGRYQFGEKTALTMRIGYPTVSVGVSFL
jgi:hypothetical protein